MLIEELLVFALYTIGFVLYAFTGHLAWLGITWIYRLFIPRKRSWTRQGSDESAIVTATLVTPTAVTQRNAGASSYKELNAGASSYEGTQTTSPPRSWTRQGSDESPTIQPPPVTPLNAGAASYKEVNAGASSYEELNAGASSYEEMNAGASSYEERSAGASSYEEMLRAFMQRSNIRWIELVSAALVVVCSVGLVVSLWSTLSRTSRFFPSLVFMLATVAVHAVGQYTLRRWNLRTTSRGILHIGLMLIPLSVLVGLLLAHRGVNRAESIPWNPLTLTVMTIGLAIYGTASWTAAAALFNRFYRLIAAAVMVASVSLLVIDALDIDRLAIALAWLMPLTLTSMSLALFLSWQASLHQRWSNGAARRQLGMAVQTLFATVLVCTVWWLKFKTNLALDDTSNQQLRAVWWTLMAAISVAWASWGWSISLARSSKSQATGRSIDSSWLIVSAWSIGAVAALVLTAATWQSIAWRPALFSLILTCALWWWAQGLICHFSWPLSLGSLAFVTSLALAIESTSSGWSRPLTTLDWISLERVNCLTIAGVVASVVGLTMTRFHRTSSTFNRLMSHLAIGGGGHVLLSALLTVLATFVPMGQTPYGGHWSAYYLICYGIGLTAAGILAERWTVWLQQHWLAGKVVPLLVPIGCAITAMATIRFFHTSPWLPEWIIGLRPGRAWSVGLISLGVLWSMLSVLLSHPTRRTLNWLNSFASVALVVGVLGSTRLRDHLQLASWLHFQLPIICAAIAWSWRSRIYRELAHLSLVWWTTASLHAIGHTQGWWSGMSVATHVSCYVACATVTTWLALIGYQSLSRLSLKRDMTLDGIDEHSLGWSAPLVIGAGQLSLLVALVPSASVSLLPSFQINADLPPMLTTLPDLSGAIGITAAIVLSAATCMVSRPAAGLGKLIVLASSAPLLLALTWTSAAEAQWAVSTCAVLLGSCLLLSEFLPLVSKSWSERSALTWKAMGHLQGSLPYEALSLLIGRVLAFSLLFSLNMLTIVGCWLGHVSSWIIGDDNNPYWIGAVAASRLAHLAWWVMPLTIVLLARWAMSVVTCITDELLFWSGWFLAIFVGASATLVAPSPVYAGLYGAIDFLECSSSAVAVLGLVAIVYRTQIRSASANSGANYSSNYGHIGLALGGLMLLSGWSAMAVVFYPAPPRFSVWPGGWPLSMAYLTTACALTAAAILKPRAVAGVNRTSATWRELSTERAWLVALLLGLGAPIVSIQYGNWLNAAPGRFFPTARGFEPYRLQIVLWLITLSIGWSARVCAPRHRFNLAGESLWFIIALATGCQALVGTLVEPSRVWPVAELACLSLLAVLSSCSAQRVWRGHVAAVLAGAAAMVWYVHAEPFSALWLTLLGPIIIGLVSVVWQLIVQYRDTNRQRWLGGYSVDQSVSCHVPITVCLLSLLATLTHEPGLHIGKWHLLVVFCAISTLLPILRLWDMRSGKRGLSIYLTAISTALTLATTISFLSALPRANSGLLWMAAGLSALALMAGLMRQWLKESNSLIPQLRLGAVGNNPESFQRAVGWMLPLHASLGLALMIPSLLSSITFQERELRLATAALPFISALSILPLATDAMKRLPRAVGLLIISCAPLMIFWSDLAAIGSAYDPVLAWHYAQRVFVTLVAMSWLYLGLAQWLTAKLDWTKLLYWGSWCCLALGAFCGLALLVDLDVSWTVKLRTFATPVKFALVVAWGALAARLLLLAMSPYCLDRGASVELRRAFVYGAEIAMGLCCLATYRCFPELFGGVIAQYWPLVVFGLAMISAAIGQWAAGSQESIIADPVRRSSLILPLIPILGVWLPMTQSAGANWQGGQSYAVILLTGAIVYGLHGWLRAEVLPRLLASALMLAAYWSWLSGYDDLQVFRHPQFWILPPAMVTLVFVEINRGRLSDQVIVAARYLAILAAYLSSTADMLLRAFDGQLWQPIILLAIAVAGVLAGIALRVRAFLFCGTAFVVVALLGMVWHAQQAIDQVWPWWAFGILTGISLIVMLGYFEKNRPRVMSYVEKLRTWEV